MKVVAQTLVPHTARQGSLMPPLALAILLAGGCAALVFNRIWLSSAQEELRTAAQTVCLAAAHDLIDDELLQSTAEEPVDVERIRQSAASLLASDPVTAHFRYRPQLQLRFGRETEDPLTGAIKILETDYRPTTVLARVACERSSGNPVEMLMSAMAGSAGDVSATAEASLTNHILGIRPWDQVAAPCWPIAAREISVDPRLQTWTLTIEQRTGPDNWKWDAEQKQVVSGKDGLPEIVLRPDDQRQRCNVAIIDLGSLLRDDRLQRQFEVGITSEDMQEFGGMLSLANGPETLRATTDFSGMPQRILESQLGQCRIFPLYLDVDVPGSDALNAVQITRLVAGRLMAVRRGDDGVELVMQPTVLTTRTAVLNDRTLGRADQPGNPYIYKVSLTQ